MERYTGKLVVAAVLIGFGVFMGMGLASKGIERVGGPQTGAVAANTGAAQAPAGGAPVQASPSSQTAQAAQTEAPPAKTAAGASLPASAAAPPAGAATAAWNATAAAGEPFINHAADKTGELLRGAAHQGIKCVVSAFGAFLE